MKSYKKGRTSLSFIVGTFATFIACSTVYASDTEIYQPAKSANTTLMFMLDISGSMSITYMYSFTGLRPQAYTACDIPANSNYTIGQERSSTNPSYTRYYCSVQQQVQTGTQTQKIYYFRGRNNFLGTPISFFSCNGTDGTTQPSTSTCGSYAGPITSFITFINQFLFGGGQSEVIGRDTYYYKYVTTPTYSTTTTKYYDRITRLKDAMFDLLDGTNGVQKLSSDLVLGVSAFSYNNNNTSGYIAAPAKVLDDSQRNSLKATIASMIARGGTPTGNAYADTASYLFGTSTLGRTYNGIQNVLDNTEIVRGRRSYIQPASIENQNASSQACSAQGVYVLTDGYPSILDDFATQSLMQGALNNGSFGCNGQKFGQNSKEGSGWKCIADFSEKLANGSDTPSGLKVKTATVGFGSEFQQMTDANKQYDPNLSDSQNTQTIDGVSGLNDDVKNTMKWGVYGKGGWYTASSSSDIVNSVNSFIGNVKTEIPNVTTGSATIPVDQLVPSIIRPIAYLSQFQPTPDQTYKLWQGNVKKYNVINNVLVDSNGNRAFNTNGELVQSSKDLWAKDDGTVGGVKSSLLLGINSANTANRKLLMNRATNGDSTPTSLTQIQPTNQYLSSTDDKDRGYIISLLGFSVDPNNPPNSVNALKQMPELRQVGAVMHSSPLLVTNGGTIGLSSSGNVVTSNRQDYVLFGTTQGLLHVVDESTGVEKFAFLPNEMVNYQKKGFLGYKLTAEASEDKIRDLYYGVDAPWSVYSEYVPTASDANTVTVGQGANNAQGLQMVYGGLRMGGRSYYALNLQNMDNPSLAFRIDPNSNRIYSKDSTVNNTSYDQLKFMAQSWSKPTVGYVNWNGTKTLVMFVGGGYDAGGANGDGLFNDDGSRKSYGGYENRDYQQTNGQGAGVYMFDALTGKLLWWTSANKVSNNNGVQYTESSDMKYSIPSEIKAVDTTGNGLINHLYFGDLGGQVWRIDLNNSESPSNFARTPVKILNLNNSQYSPRFYEKPAYTSYASGTSRFGVVSIGSGNRSRPLAQEQASTNGYQNDAIYNVFDRDVLRSDIYTTQTYNTSNTVKNDLANANTGTVSNNAKGWFYEFGSSNALKQVEKVMSYPIVIQGSLYVTTFDSSRDGIQGQCGAGVKGGSSLYKFNLPYNTSSSGSSPNGYSQKIDIGTGIVAPAVGPNVDPNGNSSNPPTGSGKVLITNTEPVSVPYTSTKGLKKLSWYELNNN